MKLNDIFRRWMMKVGDAWNSLSIVWCMDWIGFITSHVFPRYVNSLKNKNSRHSYLSYCTQGKPKTPRASGKAVGQTTGVKLF